jgi:hypothetical protein
MNCLHRSDNLEQVAKLNMIANEAVSQTTHRRSERCTARGLNSAKSFARSNGDTLRTGTHFERGHTSNGDTQDTPIL